MLKRAKGGAGTLAAGKVLSLCASETCLMQRWAAGMGCLSYREGWEERAVKLWMCCQVAAWINRLWRTGRGEESESQKGIGEPSCVLPRGVGGGEDYVCVCGKGSQTGSWHLGLVWEIMGNGHSLEQRSAEEPDSSWQWTLMARCSQRLYISLTGTSRAV